MLVLLEDLKSDIVEYVRSFKWQSVLNALLVMVLILMNASYVFGSLVAYAYDITVEGLAQTGVLTYTLSILGLGYYLSGHLQVKRLLQIGVGYLIYLAVSYSLLLTSFINRPDFKPEKTFANDFWEVRYLLTFGLIVVVAVLVKLVRQYYPLKRLNDLTVSPTFLLSGLLAVAVLCDSRLLDLVITNLTPLLSSADAGQIKSELFKVLVTLLVYIWPVCFVGVKSLSDLVHNRSSLSLAMSSSLLLALIFNYTLQSGVKGTGAYYGYYVYEGATLYQILFLFTFFFLTYCLVNRYVLATILLVAVGSMASVVNAMKVVMRSEPLLMTDLVWIKQLDLLATFVEPSFVTTVWLTLLGLVLFYFLSKRLFLRGKIIRRWPLRVGLIAGLCFFISQVVGVFQTEDFNKIQADIPLVSKLNNQHDINWLGFEINARLKSVSFVWSKQLSKRLMTKPTDYSEAAVEAVLKKYTTLAEDINKSRTEDITDQTVIYILSESFANPTYIEGISLSDNPIPFISDLATQTTSGLMKSDFYGGGTANMEFQSLTGLPFYNLSSSVAIAYTEVVPKLHYMPSISDYFAPEARIAMHPANAKNYDRYTVYQKLNFAKFLAEKGTKDKFTDPVPVGVYMGDSALYRNILEQLDVSKSQFFSIITMQNHAPWHAATPEHLTGTGSNFTEAENKHLTNYSRLLYNTDKATENFLEQLKGIDKKITVVFYGDHLPGAYPASAFENKPETQYQTDYFIWSNYQTTKLNYPLINSSDFTAALFEHTNAKVSPYYALLTAVLKESSVAQQAQGLTKEQETIANDLKLIQYDLTAGKGYILDHPSFFDLAP